MADSINIVSVQEFMKLNGFISVVKLVRTNVSKYPYITFITAENTAENIYFSINAAKQVAEGEVIARGFFEPFRIAFVVNADGQPRTKLVSQGESNRITVDDLF